jgi:hypothetical protein
VWRSSDGMTWTQVNANGFGDGNNVGAYSMAVFGSDLYVGTSNSSTGAEVWRSSDGTTWTQVNANGFGDGNNWTARSMAVFGSYLYAGTLNMSTGTEVWRTDGTPTAVELTSFTAAWDGDAVLVTLGVALLLGTAVAGALLTRRR